MKTALTVVITAVVVLLLVAPLIVARNKQAASSTPEPVPAPVTESGSPSILQDVVIAPAPLTPPVRTREPQIVSQVPPNGATGVSTSTTALIVTFDRPMAGGFSWTGGGPAYPQTTGSPTWSADRRTCMLPVRLAPNHSYRLGLNSQSFRNFRSLDGVPLVPVVWSFTTGQ